jgi:Flp pilus assembly protein TadD
MRAGEFQLALRSFNRAVARDGPTTAALVGLGSANERLGRLPQAERYLRAAVAQSPEEIVAWNNLGVVLQAQDDFIGAETAFRMAFALDSGASDVIRQNLNAAALQAQGIDRSAGGEATNRLVSLGHGRYVLGQTPEQ